MILLEILLFIILLPIILLGVIYGGILLLYIALIAGVIFIPMALAYWVPGGMWIECGAMMLLIGYLLIDRVRTGSFRH